MATMTEVNIKLTAMIDEFNKSFIEASRKVTGLGKDVDQMASKLSRASDSFNKLGKDFSLYVTAPIMALGGLAAKAFGEQEQADNKLKAALQASGQYSAAQMKTLTSYASELQGLTTIGDEVVESAMQMGLSMGIAAGDIKEATKNAIGLSKAYGLDLNQAMKLVANAQEGNFTALGRTIPAIKSAATESEKLAIYQRAVAQGFSQATAEAEGDYGKLLQLKNILGDTLEVGGQVVLQFLAPAIEAMKEFNLWLQSSDESTRKWVVGLALAVAAIGPLLMLISKLILVYRAFVIIQAAVSAGLAGQAIAANASGLALVAYKIATIAATIATKGLGAAIKANPIGLLISGLLLAVGALVKFYKAGRKARDEQDKLNAVLKLTTKELSKQTAEEREQTKALIEKNAVQARGLLYQAQVNEMLAHSKLLAFDYNLELQMNNKTWADMRKRQVEAAYADAKAFTEQTRARVAEMDKQIKAIDAVNDAEEKKNNFSGNFDTSSETKASEREKWLKLLGEYNKNEIELENLAYAEKQKDLEAALKKKEVTKTEKQQLEQMQAEQHHQNLKKIMAKYIKDENAALDEQFAKDIDTVQSGLDAQIISQDEFNKYVVQRTKELADEKNKRTEQMIKDEIDMWTSRASAVGDLLSGFADIFSAYVDAECENIDRKLNKQLDAIDKQTAAQKAALDKEIIDSKTKNKKQEEIDKKAQADKEKLEAAAEKKKRKLQREAAEIQKKVNLFETAINIPTAAYNAFFAMSKIPVVGPALGAAAAAAATALGLAKLKMINDAPLPEYAEGGVADRPSIFGEKGKELAVPLTSTQGIAAIDLFADRLLNALSLKLQKTGTTTSGSSSVNSSAPADLSGYKIEGDVFFGEEKIGNWLGTVLRRGSENGNLRFHQRGIYA
ncbi:MAG TPA: hypothetical protein PLH15_06015 [Spirochaetota bacterium]|nr:hypothetical protein [Spirochaetota bacterium]